MITIEISQDKFNDLLFNQGLYAGISGIKPKTEADKQIQILAQSYVDLIDLLKESQVKDEK